MRDFNQTIEMSKLLDLHLERSIRRESAMSKFRELATGIKEDLASWDAEADALINERHKLRAQMRETFQMHHAKHAEVRDGMNAMREAVRDASGSNSQGNSEAEGQSPPPKDEQKSEQKEGSEGSPPSFQGKAA